VVITPGVETGCDALLGLHPPKWTLRLSDRLEYGVLACAKPVPAVFVQGVFRGFVGGFDLPRTEEVYRAGCRLRRAKFPNMTQNSTVIHESFATNLALFNLGAVDVAGSVSRNLKVHDRIDGLSPVIIIWIEDISDTCGIEIMTDHLTSCSSTTMYAGHGSMPGAC